MLNFPPPPQPPVDASQLENLAEYYRELAEYYRRASEIAAGQLAHVEALLHPNELLSLSENDEDCWLEVSKTENSNGSRALIQNLRVPQLSASLSVKNGQTDNGILDSFAPNPLKKDILSKSNSATTDAESFELLTGELESNRGKILHLDYLVRKLFPAIASKELDSAKERTKTFLDLGTQQQKWFAVPDAPDCWTIDLREFPDLIEQPTPTPKSSSRTSHVREPSSRTVSSPMRTTLIGSERLERYATITLALADCLKKYYPNSMKTKQIADYFYPDGLSDTRRQKVHASLSNALSAENNKLWKRVKVGEYVWKKS